MGARKNYDSTVEKMKLENAGIAQVVLPTANPPKNQTKNNHRKKKGIFGRSSFKKYLL
jgi:hypothetical protein